MVIRHCAAFRKSCFAVLTFCSALADDAVAGQLLFQQAVDGQAITADAIKTSSPTPIDREVVDDFTATGDLQRLTIAGYSCPNCTGPLSTGVTVRIYESSALFTPGALLFEFHLDADDPRFLHDGNRTGRESGLDISFPQSLAVDGRYFLSVQLEFAEGGAWPISSANSVAPNGSAYLVRDRLSGSDWAFGTTVTGDLANHDLAFSLYGTRPGPPPSNVVAGCGEWILDNPPQVPGSESAKFSAVKVFDADNQWVVGSWTRTFQGNTSSLSLTARHSADGWAIVPSPSPEGGCAGCSRVSVNAVDGLAPYDVWAAGSKLGLSTDGIAGNQVFVMHYDGIGWSEVSAPQTGGGAGASIDDIVVLAHDDVWFVGGWVGVNPWSGPSPAALAMHWNGTDMTLVETPFPPFGTPGWSLHAVDGFDGNLWAVGGGSDGDPAPSTYFTHWNGSGWQLRQPEAPGDTKSFSHLLTVANDHAFASGESFFNGSGGAAVVAQYDGVGWIAATTPGGGGPITSFGPESVLVLGQPPIHWNGTGWSAQPSISGVNVAALDIGQTGPCSAVVVGAQSVANVTRPLLVRLEPIIFNSSFD